MVRAVLAMIFLFISLINGQNSIQWSQKGIKALKASDLSLAEIYFQKAYENSILTGNIENISRCLLNLIDIQVARENFTKAEEYLKVFPTDMSPELRLLRNWKEAQILANQSYLKALPILQTAQKQCQKENFCEKITLDYFRVQILQEDLNSSKLKDLEASLLSLKPQKSSLGQWWALKGILKLKMENSQEAVSFLGKATQEYQTAGNSVILAKLYTYLSIAYFQQNNATKADEYLLHALRMYKSLGLETPVMKVQVLAGLQKNTSPELEKLQKILDLFIPQNPEFNLEKVIDSYQKLAHFPAPHLLRMQLGKP